MANITYLHLNIHLYIRLYILHSIWLSLAWWVVIAPSKPLTTPPASVSGNHPPTGMFPQGPQPVRGAYPVGIGTLQGGHLGRWSGAAERRNLATRNICRIHLVVTSSTTTTSSSLTRIGGFQDQACLAFLSCHRALRAPGACGPPEKGGLWAADVFCHGFLPDPGTSQFR
jgi:hypothetical protein